MAQAWSAWAINWWGKTRIYNVPVQTEKTRLGRYLLYFLLCVWWVWEQFLFTWNGFKFLVHLESKRNQLEIAVKWLLSCYHVLIHNFRSKRGFKLLLLIKWRTLGDKSWTFSLSYSSESLNYSCRSGYSSQWVGMLWYFKPSVLLGCNFDLNCCFQTHPNIDKKLFSQQSIIGLKQPTKPFPLNSEIGVLKWRLQSTDEALMPLSSKMLKILVI